MRAGLFGLLLLLFSQLVCARPELLVVGSESAHHRAVFAAMQQVLERERAAPEAVFLTLEQYRAWRGSPPALLISLGSAAAQELAATRAGVPLLCVLLSQAEFLALPPGGGTAPSAIFIEQPLRRYLLLARVAVPQRRDVGAILGPVSGRLAADLRREGERLHLEVQTASISAEHELDAALGRIVTPSSVLLALPDSLVVNVDTARTLILGAYHRGAALIGYSQALAKAGALMAVHSTPEQFGREAGEMVLAALAATPPRLSPARYPSYYSVSVNYQVARALGLEIPAEEKLLQALRRQEAAP